MAPSFHIYVQYGGGWQKYAIIHFFFNLFLCEMEKRVNGRASEREDYEAPLIKKVIKILWKINEVWEFVVKCDMIVEPCF